VITLYFRMTCLLDDHIRMMEIIAKLSPGGVQQHVFAATQESR